MTGEERPVIDFPEVVEMTREESAVSYTLSDAATKPEVCTCGHEGLGMMWHGYGCPVNHALQVVREVLA